MVFSHSEEVASNELNIDLTFDIGLIIKLL